MTPQTFSTNVNNPFRVTQLFVTPLLKRIRKESEAEYSEMQQAFELLGWEELPDELKIEIYDDVKFMVLELRGYYATCDPFVQRRRNTVHYWVSSFIDGICTIETALKALKIKQF